MEDFWNMKSDEQSNPEHVDLLEEATLSLSQSSIHIFRLCREKLGTYIEIAYEWSWDEAMNMLEVLDVRDEKQDRDKTRSEAEQRANDNDN